MKAAQQQLDKTAGAIASIPVQAGAFSSQAGSNGGDVVNLSAAAIALLQAKNAHAASAAVVESAEQMMETTISLMA